MRPCSLVLAGAMLMTAITACGGSDKPKTAALASSTTGAPAATLAPTSSTSTARATTTTTIAATTTAAPTTVAATTTTLAPAPGATTTLPLCSDNPNAKTCGLDTVPLRPDIDEIIAAYRRFAEQELIIEQNPTSPDWDAYLATVLPRVRGDARASTQKRFDSGQVRNVAQGVTFNPRSTQSPDLGPDKELVADCRVDGTYWADVTTGLPIPGETTQVRPNHKLATMVREGGTWYVGALQNLDSPCSA